MTLGTALASEVSANVRAQGLALFQSGAVIVDDSHSTTLLSTVAEGRNDYEVDLELEGRTILAACNCSTAESGMVCKHVWATILAAQETRFRPKTPSVGFRLVMAAAGDDYDDDDFPYGPTSRLPTWGVTKPPKENWKDHLNAVQQQIERGRSTVTHAGIPGEREQVYVIDLAATKEAQQLVLETGVRERKKNGDWGKPRAQVISSFDVERSFNPLDRQILSMLAGAERGNSGYGYHGYASSFGSSRYRLSGPLLDSILPLLAQTGRFLLRTEVNLAELVPIVTDPGPPWVLAVSINRNPSGKQWVIEGRLRRGEDTIPLTDPTVLVPGHLIWNGKLATLDAGGAFAWIPLLRRVGKIAVPINRANELMAQLLQMPRLPRMDLPDELRVTEEAVPPRPRLVIRPSKYTYGPAKLDAELSFVYDGQIVPAEPFNRGVFQTDRKRLLLRDPEAERSAAQTLTRLGARPGGYWNRQGVEFKAALLPKIARELTTAGWQVEAEGKLYRQPGEFKWNVESGQDWFDLNASASFEGHCVPLPRLLEALQRGEQTVTLDDGSLGMLPEEWLKKYGLLAKLGTVEGDRVRFKKTQVGVLDALLASRPEVTFDQQFAHARDQLRQFEGVSAVDPPSQFRGQLRGYQREGLGWLCFLREFGFGGCLADDMGLGKTVQVLALLAGERGTNPSLVVVPRSLVFNWKQEAARFAPHLRVLDHTGYNRDRTGAAFKDYDLVLTTYGTLRNDAGTFSEQRFDFCVLDESQAAKNADTETSKAVRLLQADHRLALSGTPVENHLGELWTLFEYLNPGMLGRAALFTGVATRNPPPETRDLLGKALRPFILRRTKNQVARDLPAKTEQTIYCDLEASQRQLYDELRDHYRQSLLKRVDEVGLARSKIQVLEALLRLRQAACHPGLLDKKRIKDDSAKLDVLIPQLADLAEEGHKALVFSQFTSLLAIVRRRLGNDKVKYEYLDGRTRDRAARVERFQTDPDCKLFLISLKAGGVGLNLTAAEYVFLLDPWWNPAVEAQAIDRSHRIGQTKPVFAYRLIARGTVEEKVLALQQSKRELADSILSGDGRLITDLKREDLELLLS